MDNNYLKDLFIDEATHALGRHSGSNLDLYRMKLPIYIFYIGNLIDIVATLFFTNLGLPELNPVVEFLLNWPLLFVAIKLFVPTVLSVILWRDRGDKMAIACAWIAAFAYGAIAIYYIYWFIRFFC